MSVSLCSVVYEHRSRLEKSLQKERLEHKKAKEGEKNKYLRSILTLSKELVEQIAANNTIIIMLMPLLLLQVTLDKANKCNL